MYKIVICDDEGKTTLIPFSRTEFTIGREEGNTIRLTDRNVSRRHARLFRKGDSFFLEDLQSRNASRVDGTAVSGEVREIRLEDRIGIGDYRISISRRKYKGIPLGRQVDPARDRNVGKVTGHGRIVMIEGPTPGMEVNLTDQLYIIGRSDRANVNIEDASISRAHARLEAVEESWIISDLDSINGIHVNGEKRDDYTLKAGDVIDFGKIRFRFVAAGEPYDYESSHKRDQSGDGDEKDLRFLVLKVAVVVVLAGMLVTWLAMRTDETDGAAPQKTARRFESFEQLIRQGKTEMQAKRWEEAARLFAQAQKIRDDSPEVKKLKKVAIMEVDAKAAVEAALQAREEEKWQAALNELSRIPPDSYYYNLSFLREMGDKLCDDLVYKADFMITSGDPAAGELVDAISKIPEVSAECLARQDHLRMRLETRP